jgi:hypothetical protein
MDDPHRRVIAVCNEGNSSIPGVCQTPGQRREEPEGMSELPVNPQGSTK